MATMSLLDELAACCANGADLPAIQDTRGNSISRMQLLRRVRAIAHGFVAAGLLPGERVLFAVRPNTDAIVLLLGIAEAGGVLVPIDAATGPALFRSRMNLLSPRWVVGESLLLAASANRCFVRFINWRGKQLPPLTEVEGATFVRVGPRLPGIPVGLSMSDLEKRGAENGESNPAVLSEDDAVMIVFTSGTTDSPKAVVHTRRSMQGVFDVVQPLLDATGGDVVYAHEMHLVLPALFSGASVVVPPRSGFSAGRALRHFDNFQVSHYFGVAAELREMVEYLGARNRTFPESLREIWIGAAPVHAAFLRQLEAVLPATTNVWCVYGMTEILPVARVSLAEKVRYEGEGDLVGSCVAGVSADISADGELLLRGANLFAGYFGEPPLTELATGDLARVEEGRVALLGRRKDMIIRRQFNIYPELYESTIDSIDGVKRCAMIGIYDEVMADERVVLAVEAVAGVDATSLEARLWREMRSGPFSIDSAALPDAILVTELPLAGRSRKVDKASLRMIAKRKASCVSQ